MGGFRGRQRRIKHFGKRAEAFARDVAKGIGFREVVRDGKKIFVGTGKHRRLVVKPRNSNFRKIFPFIRRIEEALLLREKDPKTRPKSYVLVPLKASPRLEIQEYMEKPTLYQLITFLEMKKAPRAPRPEGRPALNKEEILLCKRFAKQYPDITLEMLKELEKELRHDVIDVAPEEMIFQYHFTPRNVLVLGQRKGGKSGKGDRRIKIAIIDI